MSKVKQIIIPLILLFLLYVSGECFFLLASSEDSISGSSWIVIGYFVFTFFVTCLFCYWRRNDSFGKRLSLVLLAWFLSWVLDFLMAALGIALAFQNLFGTHDIGEFGIAATEMLKGSILFRSMASATVISQIILYLYHLRHLRKKE